MDRTSTFERRAAASYRPQGGYGISDGLRRARAPFVIRNTITGVIVMGFAVGVYAYSISAVKQDDFSDVVLPESSTSSVTPYPTAPPAPAPLAASLSAAIPPPTSAPTAVTAVPVPAPAFAVDTVPHRGVLARVLSRYGYADAKTGNAIVWVAPDVDRVGKLGERSEPEGRRVV